MMATRDDVTVRIDTELRAKARELEINLSRLLEDTLRSEIERRETIAATLSEGVQEVRLDLEDEDGRPYIGRLSAKLLGEARDVYVYLADDERVIVYDADRGSYQELGSSGDTLPDWFPHDPEVVVEVLHALGETPEIDL